MVVVSIAFIPYCRLIINNVFKKFRPRPAYLAVYMMFIVGSALIADWQTLGNDPCKIFSHYHHNNGIIKLLAVWNPIETFVKLLCRNETDQQLDCAS